MGTVRFYRNKDGSVVHTADCKRRGSTSVKWLWPETQRLSSEFLRDFVRRVEWLRWCKACEPQAGGS